MLVIGGLTAGRYRYYTDAVGTPDQLAQGRGEVPGQWVGGGTGRLGLAGPVSADDLANVLAGRGRDGTALVASRRNRRAGLDLTFAAPKSVSLLLALGSPAAVRAVEQAHDAAVSDALRYLEGHACVVRRGQDRHAGAGFVAAAFRHFTSRAGDPHLHSHVVVANLVQGPEGRWSALHTPLLFAERLTADAVYQTALRHRLSLALDVGWESTPDGRVEIKGVPPAVAKAFSRRRAEILDLVERRARSVEGSVGQVWGAALSRPARLDLVDRRSLEREWRQRAGDLGFTPPVGWRIVHPGRDPVGAVPRRQVLMTRPSIDDPDVEEGLRERVLAAVTSERDSFTRSEFLRATCGVMPPSMPLAHIEQWVDQALRDQSVTALEVRTGRVTAGRLDGPDGPPIRYSTVQVDDAVSALLAKVAAPDAGIDIAVVSPGTSIAEVAGVLRRDIGAEATMVVGAAPTPAAARALEGDSGVISTDARHLAEQLEQPPDRWRLAAGSRPLVVVTGAERLPVTTIIRLIAGGQKIGARFVLVGERRAAGDDAFSRIAAMAPEALTRRVQVARSFEAPAALGVDVLADFDGAHAGHTRDVASLDHEQAVTATVPTAMGTLTASPDLAGARRALASDWALARGRDAHAVMVARDPAEVERLVALGRQALRSAGVLRGPEVAARGTGFACGDRVVARRPLGPWAEGTRAEVIDVDEHRLGVSLRSADGTVMTIQARQLSAVNHDYATVGHRVRWAGNAERFVLGDTIATVGQATAKALHRYLVVDVSAKTGLGRGPEREDPGLAGLTRLPERTRDDSRCPTVRAQPTDVPAGHVADGRATRWDELGQLIDRRRRLAQRWAEAPEDPAPRQRRWMARRREAADWCLQSSTRFREAAARAPAAADGAPDLSDRLVATWRARADEAQVALAAIDREGVELQRQSADRETWLAAHPELVTAARDLEVRTALRERALGAAAERSQRAWVANELGPAPPDLVDKLAWRAGVQALASYRERCAVDDPDRGLGTPPARLEQRLDYRRVRDIVTRVRARQPQPERALTAHRSRRGLELSLDSPGIGR